jgi:cell division protein FtsB
VTSQTRPNFGGFIYAIVALGLCVYFTFAAVQGDYGLFRRAEVNAEANHLRLQLAELNLEVARMENLTLRLSDDYLDLDLLDEQVRSVLGMVRSDEIVIR